MLEENMSDFGIVTPAFNSGSTIGETLRSIWSQGASVTIDHLVMDGGSSDCTCEQVSRFSGTRLISGRDRGQTDAINRGFQNVHGRFLAWQNADDTYAPGALERVKRFFDEHPHIDVVYGNYNVIDVNGVIIAKGRPPQWDVRQFRRGRFVPMQPTCFWRSHVWERIGTLNVENRLCMDVELFAKAASAGFHFQRLPETIGSFRMHSGSLTSARVPRFRIAREHLRTLRQTFRLSPCDIAWFWFYVLRGTAARRLRTGSW